MSQLLPYIQGLLVGVLIGISFKDKILELTTKDVEDDR